MEMRELSTLYMKHEGVESIQWNWKLLPSELYGKYSHDVGWRP
jgi:hypothetical protein